MGSLFKLRDYWSTQYNGEEFSHAYAMSVGNVDNDASGGSKIIIGSFSGMLRIIRPLKKGHAQPLDTLLERDFGEPILQVACRPLDPSSGGAAQNLLAILFPKRIVLARVVRDGASVEVDEESMLDTPYDIFILHEVHLEHTSHNFVCGAFGHAAHEMVCVQSMSGHLTVIDHSKVLLRSAFPQETFLVPGCLAYCAASDCLLTSSSSMELLCFGFPFLPAAPVSLSRGAALSPKWTFSLGADAVAVDVCRLNREGDGADIIVLCPATLFVLRSDGALRYARRLDADALCAASYFVPSAGACNALVGTAGGSVRVFSDAALEWSAKISSGAPLCLAVADVCGARGLVVSLCANGAVAVSYLGTDPAEEPVETQKNTWDDAATDSDAVEREIRALESAGEATVLSAPPVKEEESGGEEEGEEEGGEEDIKLHVSLAELPTETETETAVTATVTLLRTSPGAVGRVSLVARAVAPLRVEPTVREVARVPPGETVCVPFRVCAPSLSRPDSAAVVPSSLDVRVVAIYSAPRSGAPRAISATARAPFALVARPTPPVRSPHFVLQLNTDRAAPPSLRDLFPDFAARFGDFVSANALSVRYATGGDATALVSKSACRFRLQSSSLANLWPLADEIVRRLRAEKSAPPLRFAVPGDAPLAALFAAVDAHFSARQKAAGAHLALARAARAFRAAQNRLLRRFRDRHPGRQSAAERLIGACHAALRARGVAAEDAENGRRRAAAALSGCARVVVMGVVAQCAERMTAEEARRLEDIFTCDVEADGGETGWEEITRATLERICRNGRHAGSRAQKEGGGDVERLKEYIRELFDQLISGSRRLLT